MLIGFWLAGTIYNKYALPDGTYDWKMIWIIPGCIAAAVMLFYAFAFKNEVIESKLNVER
jgi:hypothetical protein